MTVTHSHSHSVEKITNVEGVQNSDQKELRDEFKQGVEQTKNQTDESALEEAVATGLIIEAVNQVTLQQLRQNLDQMGPTIKDIHAQGMERGAADLRRLEINDIEVLTESGQARRFIQSRTANLVQGISQKSREAIQQAVTRGVSNNLNTQTVARQVRRSIGLTKRQEAAVANFRRMLIEQDPDAIGRFLDASERQQVRRIVNRGGTIDEIDDLTDKYAQHQVNIRARNIARTETVRARSMGKINQVRALDNRGIVDKTTLVKKWQTQGDSRVCPWCQALNGTTVGIETTFQSSQPFETKPGVKTFSNIAPPLHPRCRCFIEIERL